MDEKSVSFLYRYKLIMSSEKKYICKNIGSEKSWLCAMVSLGMEESSTQWITLGLNDITIVTNTAEIDDSEYEQKWNSPRFILF